MVKYLYLEEIRIPTNRIKKLNIAYLICIYCYLVSIYDSFDFGVIQLNINETVASLTN